MTEIIATIKKAKLRLLKMHFDSVVGHIGGNLSSLDAMIVLHHRCMKDCDSFILSKGHAAGALYVTLWTKGAVSEEELSTFHQEGTRLAGHPAGALPGVLFPTGSLGHGLGLAAGTALGRRFSGTEGTIYCMTSDGEWQEGSTWESLNFSVHHRLDNLTVLVDENGLQGFGRTADVLSPADLATRLASSGAAVSVVNGHDPNEIEEALLRRTAGPKVIVLKTVKGHGVSFMENKMEWHYLPLTKEQYEQAVREVGGE